MEHQKGMVFYNENAWSKLDDYIQKNDIHNTLVILDEHIELHCLPLFIKKFSKNSIYNIIRIPAGEENKTIQTVIYVWETLAKKGADKKSLIINLGGGMITDLGGFVATTYKRGIPFIHIPTTLLAMVDAAIGGKNGIDFEQIKNQIGTIQLPEMILIDTDFLFTLPKEQFRSGMAEVIKHALIKDEAEWNELKSISVKSKDRIYDMIPRSIQIKETVVAIDPYEKKERKILNYGHTLGHAIEAHALMRTSRPSMLHGEAVAIGLILESYLSYKLVNFERQKLDELTSYLLSMFSKQEFDQDDITDIMKLTKFDKKNANGQVRFVLMEDFGNFRLDRVVPDELIYEAFAYYRTF